MADRSGIPRLQPWGAVKVLVSRPQGNGCRGCLFTRRGNGTYGAGKSTHLGAVAARLGERGAEVVRTREPGGTGLAERLRELVLHAPMDALTEALLVFAARPGHTQRVILPALERGATVLCDRYSDASFAYQGHGRGFDAGVLAALEGWVHDGLQPALTLWFDVPPAVAAALEARGW